MKQSTGTPPREGTPDRQGYNDQMQIMQSLMEIHREIAVLSTKTERLIADVGKVEETAGATSKKIARWEAIVVATGAAIIVFCGIFWWLTGAQITALRDQLIKAPPSPVSTTRP